MPQNAKSSLATFLGRIAMYLVFVHVHVKPDCREGFIQASLENAKATTQEPGNLRFDVVQQVDDPDRFVLVEVYRDEAGMEAHKQTAHYAKWRDSVASWMAEPRKGVKYAALFPPEEWQWAGK
jgi:quinol monooxygenase YgiN